MRGYNSLQEVNWEVSAPKDELCNLCHLTVSYIKVIFDNSTDEVSSTTCVNQMLFVICISLHACLLLNYLSSVLPFTRVHIIVLNAEAEYKRAWPGQSRVRLI